MSGVGAGAGQENVLPNGLANVGATQCATKKAGVLVIYTDDKNNDYVLVGTQGGYLEDLDLKLDEKSVKRKITLKIDNSSAGSDTRTIWDWQSFNTENNPDMAKIANNHFSNVAKKMSEIAVLGLEGKTDIQYSTPEYGPKKEREGNTTMRNTDKLRWNTTFHRINTANQKLSIPKGGVKAGETCLQAALREFKEEIGFGGLYTLNKLNDQSPSIVLGDTTVFLVKLAMGSNTKTQIETAIKDQKARHLGELFDVGFKKIVDIDENSLNGLTKWVLKKYREKEFKAAVGASSSSSSSSLGKRTREESSGGKRRHTRRRKSFRKKTLHKKH